MKLSYFNEMFAARSDQEGVETRDIYMIHEDRADLPCEELIRRESP